MSEKHRRGGNYGKGTFIDTSLFLSPAFLSLGAPGTAPQTASCSCQMLIMILGKRGFTKNRKGKGKPDRTDNNKFNLTYAELKAHGISNTKATRGFSELLAKGFIEIAHQGGAYEKDKSQYALIDDYLLWRPGQKPIRKRSPDIVKRGYQKKKKEPMVFRRKKTKTTITDDGHPHNHR